MAKFSFEKVSFLSTRILLLILSIIIFGFDAKLMSDNSSYIKKFLHALSYNGYLLYSLSLAYTIIGIFCITILFFITVINIFLYLNDKTENFHIIYLLLFPFILIIIESMAFKFYSCINFTSKEIINARVGLKFLFLISLGAIFVARYILFFRQKNIPYKKLTIVGIPILFFILLITNLILNILIAINLEPSTSSAPDQKRIKVLVFSDSEMSSMENEGLTKDKYFSSRFLFNLSQLRTPQNLLYQYTTCTRECGSDTIRNKTKLQCSKICTKHSVYSIKIVKHCSKNLNAQFYRDCIYSERKLIFNITSTTKKSGVFYNCELKDEFGCKQCNLDGFSPYLVQEKLNELSTLVLAWYEFLNCNEPTKLILDNNLGICAKNKSMKIFQTNLFIWSYFVLIFFYFNFN